MDFNFSCTCGRFLEGKIYFSPSLKTIPLNTNTKITLFQIFCCSGSTPDIQQKNKNSKHTIMAYTHFPCLFPSPAKSIHITLWCYHNCIPSLWNECWEGWQCQMQTWMELSQCGRTHGLGGHWTIASSKEKVLQSLPTQLWIWTPVPTYFCRCLIN